MSKFSLLCHKCKISVSTELDIYGMSMSCCACCSECLDKLGVCDFSDTPKKIYHQYIDKKRAEEMKKNKLTIIPDEYDDIENSDEEVDLKDNIDDVICFVCRKEGHYANQCPIKKIKCNKRCYKCDKKGHYANQCDE